MHNKECALAHSRACGGRLRHLPYTPQCASSRSVFYFTGKQFPVKHRKNSTRLDIPIGWSSFFAVMQGLIQI